MSDLAQERSSSAVRNLRSLFENKSSDQPSDGRGRSPGDLSAADYSQQRQQQQQQHHQPSSRPTSKIRASFIPVEPPTRSHTSSPSRLAMNMASAPDFSKIPNSDAKDVIDSTTALNREPGTGRRTSFREDLNSSAVQALKVTVVEEGERRKSHAVAETIPERAVETPLVEANKQIGVQKSAISPPLNRTASSLKNMENAATYANSVDKEAKNPDKPLAGAEEEPAVMKLAAPTSADAACGVQAIPPVAEDLRKTSSKVAPTNSATTKPAPKPAASSTASKAAGTSTGIKSPPPTTSLTRNTASPTPVSKKPSRSSLTAPTAASVAKVGTADKTASKPAAPKPKPREPTKPVEVSSRLTAPTAASRARVEGPSAPATKPTTTPNRLKPTVAARPSLGRPDSRSSQHATKKASAPVDGSFLDRMTRPTAAFANRTAKEAESKAAALKQKLPTRPKTNGQSKKAPKPAVDAAEQGDETIIDDPSVVHEGSQMVDSTEQAQTAAADNRPGSPKADHTTEAAVTNGHHHDGEAEATPAALGAGDSTR